MRYEKLVRDKIPSIIEAGGKTPITRILSQEEYRHYLEAKLDEEVAEFHKDKNAEELADILEVVYGLAEAIGCGREELMETYRKKHDASGGFADRILLVETK